MFSVGLMMWIFCLMCDAGSWRKNLRQEMLCFSVIVSVRVASISYDLLVK